MQTFKHKQQGEFYLKEGKKNPSVKNALVPGKYGAQFLIED